MLLTISRALYYALQFSFVSSDTGESAKTHPFSPPLHAKTKRTKKKKGKNDRQCLSWTEKMLHFIIFYISF